MFIKVCGITNEEDALAVTALGADAVGFVFASSPRQVSAGAARDIIRRLPPDVLPVGVFRDEEPNRVVSLGLKAGVKAVQLHGHESPETAEKIRPHFPVLIMAMPAGDRRLRRFADYRADALLLDSPTPGSGEVFDWSLADGIPAGQKIILAGGLTPTNVGEAIRRVSPYGVDVSSGVERAPGMKDPLLVQGFIRAARAAARDVGEGPDSMEFEAFDWQTDLI